ncbi:MAG: nucleoside kinase [Muribaculaceae bacterium]|nr:nucleoside kinase [Muribaculaceae bacterium]
MKIYCTNLQRYIPVEGGTSLRALAASLRDELPFEPICARVNNKTESLEYEIYNPRQIEFLDITSSSGSRVYLRSLCMILYRALWEVAPRCSLRIEHSVSRGHYCRIIGMEPDEKNAARLRNEMQEIIHADLPFVREQKLTADVLPVFERQGLEAKVALLRTTRTLYTTFYTLDGLSDSYYGTLATHTGIIRGFDLLPYKEGFLLMSFDPDDPDRAATPIPQDKMYQAFTDYLRFNRITGVETVGGLNRVVEQGRTADIINVAEALHEKSISHIADDIAARYDAGGARIVLISGPSSSGKTTSTKRLAIQLMTRLLKPQMISLDDYFVDRHRTPRDEDGEFDYESLYALDLDQFNTDLTRILAGEEVKLPTYNFETGEREYRGNSVRLEEGSILLIEGIHGLNPELTSRIPEEMKYRLYVSALTTLSIDFHNWVPTTDTRLLRRIVRDARYRGLSAEETIRRWPSVRRGEEKWIFPYQENADAMFNSSLVFELAIIKDFADSLLRTVPEDVPEYAEAYRLRKFLSYFLPISKESVPSTSILREFLGGSSFKY